MILKILGLNTFKSFILTMTSKRHNLIQNWEIALLAISLLVIQFVHSFISHESKDIVFALLTGIISALFLLVTERLYIAWILKEQYNKSICGSYIRIEIGKDGEESLASSKFWVDNIGLRVFISYVEKHTIKITADYWKNDEVTAYVNFSQENLYVGNGTYYYSKVDTSREYNHENNRGIYKIFRQENSSDLLVLFEHIYPRDKGHNPNLNKGWEIWQKV